MRTASFCIPPYLYDPPMERLDSVGAFIAALRRADEDRVPLLLNVGMPWAARKYSPQMWSLFTNRELFEEPLRLRGFEPSLDTIISPIAPKALISHLTGTKVSSEPSVGRQADCTLRKPSWTKAPETSIGGIICVIYFAFCWAAYTSQFAENCLPWPDDSFELIQFSISCLWAGQRGARLKDEREKS